MSAAKPRRRSLLHRLLRIAALVYALWLVALFVAQRTIIFPSALVNDRYVPPPEGVEVWRERRPDGVTAFAWFVPAQGDASAPAPAIVLLHGNAMLVGDWIAWAERLSRGGVHVLMPEFRGYGASEGSPTREALVGDTVAMIEALGRDPRVDRNAIVLYGRSIGGSIAAEAAAALAEPPAALVLHTAPARIAELAWRFAAPPLLVRDAFDAESAVTALRGRTDITVIGHDRDEVVPSAHAERLAGAGGVPLVTIGGTHNAFAGAEDRRRFEGVIDGVLRATRQRGGVRP